MNTLTNVHRVLFVLIALHLFVIDVNCQLPVFEPKTTSAGILEVDKFGASFGHGSSAADFNNDGYVDFYLCTAEGIPNRLYQNNGDGSFEDIASQSAVDLIDASRVSLWFDYNGDEILDLVVCNEPCMGVSCENQLEIALFKGTESGIFEDVTSQTEIDLGNSFRMIRDFAMGGLTAADLNNDNWIDLVISTWGGGLILLLNDGDGTFTDFTQLSGIGRTDTYYWQTMVYDFNADGLVDIYCNVDFESNELWFGQEDGTFTEVAKSSKCDDDHAEMGLTAGDFDNDGDFDIYVTNITQTWGGEYFHNLLYENDFDGNKLIFDEASGRLKVFEGGWDWGCTFFDFNNDGWLDLASTNGWHAKSWHPDQSKLWMNQSGSFEDVSSEVNFNDSYNAGTLISFDMDRDGDMDLLQTLRDNDSFKFPVVLYENKLKQSNYIVVKPRMNTPNHFAIGTTVRVKTKNANMSRLITSGTSFYGQEPAEAFFGIGSNEETVDIKIEWPDRTISVYEDKSINQELELVNEVIIPPANPHFMKDGNKYILTWKDQSDNEDKFVVHYSNSQDFDKYSEIDIYADTLVNISSVFSQNNYFRVKAVNRVVSSDFSETISTESILHTSKTYSNKLYPNPITDGIFHIENNLIGIVQVDIYNASGQLAEQYRVIKESAVKQLKTSLQSGLYVVVIKSKDQIRTVKLLISN